MKSLKRPQMEPKKKGNLVLVYDSEKFKFLWNILDEKTWFIPIGIEQTTQESKNLDEFESFLAEINEFTFISLLNEPLRIQFHCEGSKTKREFIINESVTDQFIDFIENIILYGIALPTNKKKNSLEIYKNAHKEQFTIQPYHLHITYSDDIGILFNNICEFTSSVIKFYDQQKSIPVDPSFPLQSMALCDVERLHNKYIKAEKLKKIEPDEWNSFFDKEGKFINFNEVKERSKIAGIDNTLLPEFLPFIAGVFETDSTYKEREQLRKKLVTEFKCLKEQSRTLSNDMLANNFVLNQYATTIVKDVKRTDRGLKCFINLEGEGPQILTDLLNSYLLCNPDIYYLQGMNDIIVPILLAYIPEWDDKSNPICDNIEDIDEKLAMVFWCYSGMLDILNHKFLLSDLTNSEVIAAHSLSYIGNASPALKFWYESKGITSLTFVYSEFIYLYKRTFENIWRIWIFFLAHEKPNYALSLFTASILYCGFPQVISMKKWNEPMMNKEFPNLLKTLDVEELLFFASEIYDPKIKFQIDPRREKQTNKVKSVQKSNLHFLKFADFSLTE